MTELARYAGSRTGAGYHPVPSQSAREVQRASSGIAPLGQHEIGALVQRALQDFSLEDPDATVQDCTASLHMRMISCLLMDLRWTGPLW